MEKILLGEMVSIFNSEKGDNNFIIGFHIYGIPDTGLTDDQMRTVDVPKSSNPIRNILNDKMDKTISSNLNMNNHRIITNKTGYSSW